MSWTQEDITRWAVDTFGRPTNALDLIDRAKLEFDELFELTHSTLGDETVGIDHVSVDKVLEEIADVVIVLSQVVEHLDGDLQNEIDKKMKTNYKRKWIMTGDGVGRHQ